MLHVMCIILCSMSNVLYIMADMINTKGCLPGAVAGPRKSDILGASLFYAELPMSAGSQVLRARAPRLRRLLLGALIVVLTVVPAEGQPLILSSFEAGGTTNVLEYAEEREQAIQGVLEAVEHVFSVYQPLWKAPGGSEASTEIDFQLYVVLRWEMPPDKRASAGLVNPSLLPQGATATRPVACRVTVYNYLLSSRLLFDIAHEMAHCYQQFYIGGAQNYAVTGTEWWVEGSAEWMALLAYPNAEWSNLDVVKYGSSHRQYLFALAYDAVFFWQFLAGPTGLGSVQAAIEFLRAMPPTPPAATGYEQYLSAATPDVTELFHNYAVAVGRRYLPRSPDIMKTTDNIYDISPLPSESPVNTEPFSIDYYKLIGVGFDGMYVEGVNLDTAGIRASIISDGGNAELLAGDPILLCPPHPLEFFIGISKAPADPFAGDGLIRVTPASEQACAENVPYLTPGMLVVPNCIAGDWYAAEIPEISGLLSHVDLDVLTDTSIDEHFIGLTITGDSTIIIHFTVKSTTPQAQATIQAVLTGYIGIQPSKVRGNSYDIVSAYTQVVPGTAGGYSNVGGIVVDVTDTLREIFLDPTNLMPYPHYLTCTGEETMDYIVYVDGVEQIWRMKRLQGAS